MVPLSPQALLTGNFSRQSISCNLLPDNYQDKFQASEFAIPYRFLTDTWKRQNHRLPAEFLWEVISVIFDRLVTGEYSGRINLVMMSVTMVMCVCVFVGHNFSALQTHPNLHSPVWVGVKGGRPRRGSTNLGVFVPIWPVIIPASSWPATEEQPQICTPSPGTTTLWTYSNGAVQIRVCLERRWQLKSEDHQPFEKVCSKGPHFHNAHEAVIIRRILCPRKTKGQQLKGNIVS